MVAGKLPEVTKMNIKFTGMVKPIDEYFLRQDEPGRSCLMALREMILKFDPDMTETWQYGMPFYCYKGKRCCYLWLHKKYLKPYLGIVDGKYVDHPALLVESRKRMKIMLVDPGKDLPVTILNVILLKLVTLHS